MKNSPPSRRFVGFGRMRLRTLIFSDGGKRQGILDPFSPWRRPGWSRIGVLVGWNVLRLLIGSLFWTSKRVIGASYRRFLVFPMGYRCSVSWWESSQRLWWWAGGIRIHGRFRALCLFTISCLRRGGGERICQLSGGRSLDVRRRVWSGWCMWRVGMMVRITHWSLRCRNCRDPSLQEHVARILQWYVASIVIRVILIRTSP